MRVEIRISADIQEPYIVLYARQMTPELQAFAASLGGEEQVFTAMHGERMVILQPQEIYLVRVDQEKTCIFGKTKEYVSNKRLYEWEEQLGKGFLRISKSAIVNLKYIDSVEPGFGGSLLLHMKNGSKEYISRKYLPAFKKYLGI